MVDRITPYKVGGKIDDRIDEIVLTGANISDGIHIEMMGQDCAWMRIGTRIFAIFVDNKKLVIAFREGDPDAGR